MKMIQKFSDLVDVLASMHVKRRVAVACPYDDSTLHAVERCITNCMAEFILIGTADKLSALRPAISHNPSVRLIEADSDIDAVTVAIVMARNGEVDVVMKGLVSTDVLLKGVLNKEHGLLPAGRVLTHLSVAELPDYHKLLFFSDVAVIPYPTHEQREAVIRYDIDTCRKFGIKSPKVALIHFTEKVNPKFPNSTDYVRLIEMAREGKFGEAELAGPMDVKTACDEHSAEVKGITSGVCGNADLLIFPNIESGNTFYKTITLFGGGCVAGMLQGTSVPVVLPSRSDSADSKFYSIALACMSV